MDDTGIIEQLERMNLTHAKILAIMGRQPSKIEQFFNSGASVATTAGLIVVLGQVIMWILGR